MQNIQDLFDALQATKKEQKEVKREYHDALTNSNGYEEVNEELKKLREKKKKIEAMTQSRMGERYILLENLKKKIDELDQSITDIAMTTLMEGKSIEIKDQYDNLYEPTYKIIFKKSS